MTTIAGQPRHRNRLLEEESPYLRQHGHQAIDWYPWGEAAFTRARDEDRAIFLSIGYSSCHWCQAMAREAFADQDVARLLNRRFVAIKVDREQRPDLDEIYMTALQLLSRQGGWPLNCFLDLSGNPFFAGTYFAADRFRRLLEAIDGKWMESREELVANAARVGHQLELHTQRLPAPAIVDETIFAHTRAQLLGGMDKEFGGFAGVPKFPHETRLMYLWDCYTRDGDLEARDGVLAALDAMVSGGFFDHVGGGFHRHAADHEFRIPHFEKMLYNQALLVRVYAEAYAASGEGAYRRVVERTVAFVERELMRDDGVFVASLGADSEGEEGAFYCWSVGELRALLGDSGLAVCEDALGVSTAGNFRGTNVLQFSCWLRSEPASPLRNDAERVLEQLLVARQGRTRPERDDKVIAAWNGAMIGALVVAAGALRRADYLSMARRCAGRLVTLLWDGERLRRQAFGDHASLPGLVEDCAFLCEALVLLHLESAEIEWLEVARGLVARMNEDFWDREHGGFYLNRADQHPFAAIVRPKSPMDGALPSANSVALRVLTRLHEATGDSAYREQAVALLQAFSGLVAANGTGFTFFLLGARELVEGRPAARG